MIPLHVRSSYSLLRGTASPAALCRQAKEYSYRRLALTDHENLYGLWPFLRACRREGIRPIIGAEIKLPAKNETLVLLVGNDEGYRHLSRMISAVRLGGSISIDKDIEHNFKGLVILTKSPLLLEHFHGANQRVVANLGNCPTEAASMLRKLAARLRVPAVATPDSDMACRSDNRLYQLLHAIDNGLILPPEGNRTRVGGMNGTALERPGYYRDCFAVWPDAVSATEEVAEMCSFTGPRFGTVMPPWRPAGGLPPGKVLREQAYRGAGYRYGGDLSETVVDRLEHELEVIERMGFSSYFLVVRDIVHPPARDGNRRRRRICGRGSGAASLVAYCLGITNVCPVKHNLYFERFLNPGRSDPPDIDIDFAWDERDDVLAEVFDRYTDHVAMVCNHVCFKPRLAIRETARAFGMPGHEISRMTKRLPWFHRREGVGLQEQIAGLPALRDQDFSAPWPEIIRLADRLIGLPRYLSVHPGGVVITPAPVSDYVPVERAAKGVPIIQWEKDGAEEAGLVKIDLLGNRSLGVIRDAVANLRGNSVRFPERNWEPEDDGETKAAVAAGRTMGCFYIESPAMRLLQRKANSGEFEQLVIQSSIIRPAANEFVREYVRRLHGGTWSPLHPDLEEVLDETFGLMVYQEDVSRVAVALAGFSHAEADGLRKVMSKKDRELRLNDYRKKFYEGCRNKGIGESDIDRIWAMMMSFDGYSFCKPHSASYARVSYQAAYLKTHFPAEFMAAVISNQGGYYSIFAYVSEAKRLGLIIDPPDVRVSDYRWRGCRSRLRVGLQAVRELSYQTADRIIDSRGERGFRDIADFMQRAHPADNEMRSLIDAGALDGLVPGGTRSMVSWQAACSAGTGKLTGNRSLFGSAAIELPNLEAPSYLELLRREYRSLGFLCRHHPVGLIRPQVRKTLKICELGLHIGRNIQCIGRLLTGKMVSTKTGEVMEFLTFEDETGMVETTFFPAVYRRYAHILAGQKVYLLDGLVESDYGAITLTVKRLQLLKTGCRSVSS